jgi:hypothetical protein
VYDIATAGGGREDWNGFSGHCALSRLLAAFSRRIVDSHLLEGGDVMPSPDGDYSYHFGFDLRSGKSIGGIVC